MWRDTVNLIGVGSFLCLSLLVALALALVLGTIGRQISELYVEIEDWSTMPITRDADQQPSSPADAEMGRTAWHTFTWKTTLVAHSWPKRWLSDPWSHAVS
jgi:hypothetical protein